MLIVCCTRTTRYELRTARTAAFGTISTVVKSSRSSSALSSRHFVEFATTRRLRSPRPRDTATVRFVQLRSTAGTARASYKRRTARLGRGQFAPAKAGVLRQTVPGPAGPHDE